MDVREKLVELIRNAHKNCKGKKTCHECEKYGNGYDCVYLFIADELIAHGVTVQEWISVKDRLPQEDAPESSFCEQVQVLLDNGLVSTGWCNRHFKMWWHLDPGETRFIGFDYDHTPVIAWQPLAQPPKGE